VERRERAAGHGARKRALRGGRTVARVCATAVWFGAELVPPSEIDCEPMPERETHRGHDEDKSERNQALELLRAIACSRHCSNLIRNSPRAGQEAPLFQPLERE
jgi:hypothetical protein